MRKCEIRARGAVDKLREVFLGEVNFQISADLDSGASLCFLGVEDFNRYKTFAEARGKSVEVMLWDHN